MKYFYLKNLYLLNLYLLILGLYILTLKSMCILELVKSLWWVVVVVVGAWVVVECEFSVLLWSKP